MQMPELFALLNAHDLPPTPTEWGFSVRLPWGGEALLYGPDAEGRWTAQYDDSMCGECLTEAGELVRTTCNALRWSGLVKDHPGLRALDEAYEAELVKWEEDCDRENPEPWLEPIPDEE